MKVIRDTREGVLISGIPQITCNQIVCTPAMKNKPLNSQVSVEHTMCQPDMQVLNATERAKIEIGMNWNNWWDWRSISLFLFL